MPVLHINTNVDQSAFTEDMLKSITSKMAKLVGKPESYMMVIVRGNQFMSFGGTTEPCAFCTFESIGCISEKENTKYAKEIFAFVAGVGVKGSRVYIKFANLSADHVAWDGMLFSQ